MKRINVLIGYLLLIIGIIFTSTNLIIERNEKIKESNKIDYTLGNQISYIEKDDLYDIILSIPKIKLRKGIYSKKDKRNNIEKNVMIHMASDYPDKDKSNVILVAHSGSGDKAFFNDLDQLNEDTLIELYYNHTKYVYKFNNYYNVEKNGKVYINRDKSKKTITLITCNKKDKTKQVVYIGYLIDETHY